MAEKYTFKQFQAQYPDDEACLRSIFNRKFGETKHCPSCGVESKLTKIEGRRAYACQEGCHIYPCAWRLGHQLRELMAARDKAQNPAQLSGHVEVDETYIGGYQKRDKKNHVSNKTIVMGFVQRGGDYRAEVIPANTKARLVPRVVKHVAPGSTVNTDSLRSYRTLGKLGYNHVAVNHEDKQWAIGIHNTNSIEGFWSHLKRGLSPPIALCRQSTCRSM